MFDPGKVLYIYESPAGVGICVLRVIVSTNCVAYSTQNSVQDVCHHMISKDKVQNCVNNPLSSYSVQIFHSLHYQSASNYGHAHTLMKESEGTLSELVHW